VAYAKANPGKVNYASPGSGSQNRLETEHLRKIAGLDMVHVPYKGGGPALTDLLAGQVGIYFSGISSVLPYVREGRLRGLAVTSAKRTAVMPDTPTIAESGLPGYEVGNWYAIVAPAATPMTVVTQLNREIVRALTVPGVKKRFLELAADPVGSTPGELTAYNRSEIAKWANVIKSAGIKPE